MGSLKIQKKYDITRDTANRDLVGLIKSNIIKKEGIGKSTRYCLK